MLVSGLKRVQAVAKVLGLARKRANKATLGREIDGIYAAE